MNRPLSGVMCAAVLAGMAIGLQACSRPEPAAPAAAPKAPFNVVEATIPQMQKALADGQVTSHQLVVDYLARIGLYEDKLHAAITVNPNAIKDADQSDRDRAAGHIRGPLEGIPIALKDNILTTEMPTTGGALAFFGYTPPYEATLVKNLENAGAIIIAKAGMSELANWVAGFPTPMPGDYNAVGGQGYNPYDPRMDPRAADRRPALSPAGSSSGIGTSANMWAANIGSETSGSILGPSNATMLAAIKPTVGRVSRWGVIPITEDQDTAGPMAKSVAGAAILLGAMEAGNPDPNDPATSRCTVPPNHDYTVYLKADGLKGARIGIPRAFYYDPVAVPGGKGERGGLDAARAKVMAEAIAVLKAQGAVIVDPANIPSILEKDPKKNFLLWNQCSGADHAKGKDADCSIVLKYGMKRDFNKFLATLGPTAPVKTLTALREWNLAHQQADAIKYGQSELDISDQMDVVKDKARYEADRAKDIALAGTNGIDAVMKEYKLDAILFPGASGAGIAAKPGYPTVIVPFGMVPNDPTVQRFFFRPGAPKPKPFPPGFDAKPAPFGVSFTGMACSEPQLITLAYAFEQATHKRVPPPGAP
ncbi:MAG: amidase [Acidobacteriota bacterium]|nr:amidase [Acidobacteriota bacterium]